MMKDSFHDLLAAFLGTKSVAKRLAVFRTTALGPLVRATFLRGRDEADALLLTATHERYLWGQYFEWHFNKRYGNPGVGVTGDPFLCALLESAVASGPEHPAEFNLEAAVRTAAADFRVKRFWQYLHGDALLGFPAKMHHSRFLTTFRDDAANSPVRSLKC